MSIYWFGLLAGSPVQKRASGDEVADRTAHVFFGPFHLRSVDKNAERGKLQFAQHCRFVSQSSKSGLVHIFFCVIAIQS